MPHPRRVVFLIDSDESSRVTHETILRTEGYDMIGAPDGTAALQLLREQSPDLLLVGARIGSMSTLQLIRLVKSDSKLSEVPVLVYAPSSQAAIKEDVMRAGASAFLVLPVTAHELIREVVGLVGRA